MIESLPGLVVLDLRDNELGDDGADTIMKMIIANYFHNLVELHLQSNNIKDLGQYTTTTTTTITNTTYYV